MMVAHLAVKSGDLCNVQQFLDLVFKIIILHFVAQM